MRTTWLKSTLLRKIKCFVATFYMETQCLQTNGTQYCLGKENTGLSDDPRDRVCANKKFNLRERAKMHLGCNMKGPP